MALKPRPRYLKKLLDFKDSEFIKVIVGMRRCGKSSLLALFAEHLKETGVAEDRIISVNFETAEYLNLTDYQKVLDALLPLLSENSAGVGAVHYLLLDEIQLVDQWEKAVNALRLRPDVDLYITGSNAYMLSSQLATLLSGRFVEIPVYPLSFREFADFVGAEHPDERLFQRFATYGGLPPVVEQGENRELAQTVLSGVYGTVFVKDIAQHVQIRNQAVFSDIAAFLADTAGSSVSIVNIEKRLRSAHRKTSTETIERYLQALVDAFLFYRAKRCDLRGGALLQGLDKYYPSDPGIRNMLLGFPSSNYGFALKGIIHNELLIRGYEVRVGKLDSLEVDFVATKPGETLFIQVCASLLEDATRRRELAPLKKLSANEGRKLVITFDTIGLEKEGTVEIVNAIRWLLKE